MTVLYLIFSILQSLAISLGVGCSTVAIVYYLTGKHDGPYDPTNQHYTRIVAILLRIALVLIVITVVGTATLFYVTAGAILLNTYTFATWTFIIVLVLHAVLLWLRKIPHVIGPGLQVSTWYAFGVTVAIPSNIILNMSYVEFMLWYAGCIGVVLIFINLVVAHQKGDL